MYFLLCQTSKLLLFEINFQKVDQYTGGKWLIHGIKQHKDNQFQSLGFPSRISYLRILIWHMIYLPNNDVLSLSW